MIGAIAGDIIGSVYEVNPLKTKDFPLFTIGCTFTDDTVLTVALADSILNNIPYVKNLKKYYHDFYWAGYGGAFQVWAVSRKTEPYNSWGNGSAMRVSPVGFAYNDLETVLEEAKHSAEVTHNHPEGIKGAQATAAAIFLARTGNDKPTIKDYIEKTFGYDLSTPLDQVRQSYYFDVSCQGSVPQSIIAFLESSSYEDAIRNAISLGGDSDTMACITGGMAQAFYGGVPDVIQERVFERLDKRLSDITKQFMAKYL
ncbi:MAG: ADP-ribosylglycohydrolase family protein [Candidatus Parabeggiatoa sp. nov. 3]|nr:MAG: ADP-ribosylglycohydrolase family protein [Gammaproteobacteria bacterium]RKZ81819.1 MAG: ADP-ribosylglycohydrolase family protein [Gammaproteobacteria bacterium]HEW97745.1 ADP-ribosylglycohydrolase family protein [Beggiatoa sp.]